MTLKKEPRERVVSEDIFVAECDQCGRREEVGNNKDRYSGLYPEYPERWLRVGPTDDLGGTAPSFCSWACVAEYARAKCPVEREAIRLTA